MPRKHDDDDTPLDDGELAAQAGWIRHMRGLAPHRNRNRRKKKTICRYGHPLTVRHVKGQPRRECAECRRLEALLIYHRRHPDAPYKDADTVRRFRAWLKQREQNRRHGRDE